MAKMKRIVLMGMLVEAALLTVFCSVLWFWHAPYGKSGLFGCLIFYIPNTYFAIYAFRYQGASLAVWIVRSFYWGQTGKLALIAVAFALVFHFHKDLRYEALFLGFIFMILVHLAVATWMSNRLSILTQREA